LSVVLRSYFEKASARAHAPLAQSLNNLALLVAHSQQLVSHIADVNQLSIAHLDPSDKQVRKGDLLANTWHRRTGACLNQRTPAATPQFHRCLKSTPCCGPHPSFFGHLTVRLPSYSLVQRRTVYNRLLWTLAPSSLRAFPCLVPRLLTISIHQEA
jgi:hypothetical protein